jgi:hypothetical protein
MTARVRDVHNKKPLTFRKGKTRLRAATIPQLIAITEKEKTGKRYEAARKEIVRKKKMGIVYNEPAPAEEPDNEEIRNN